MRLGALAMAFGVALGAFGAHGLRGRLTPDLLAIYETGVRYHLVHALGLFVYALGFGQSILSAGLTLALLILPIVIVATREALRAVPSSIREAFRAPSPGTAWVASR